MGICLFCGRPTEAKHHLIYGTRRGQAEKDGLTAPVCNNCHNMGHKDNKIHGNIMAEKMSKMIGQLAYEKHLVSKGMTEEEAREAFRGRYKESYL